MHTNIRAFPLRLPNTWHWLVALLTALVAALSLAVSAHAAPPPEAACTRSGTTLNCELWAKAGTFSLPGGGGNVTVWGYTDTSAGVISAPGGPTLTANEGDTVTIVLHNDLAEVSSLALHGQGLAADPVGAAGSGTKTYTFTASRAGTFLYEAGLTPNGPHQVAMGLYGALVVKPTTPPGTYATETVVLLSEIDPELNAAPATFNMGEYKPTYWLINGQAYPGTDNITVAASQTTRIRYVNAGLNENSMALLGLTQQVIAADGFAVPSAYSVVAETVPPGGTLDTLVAVPAGAATGTQYALYSAAQHLDNAGAAYGGQLTNLEVGTGSLANMPPVANGDAYAVDQGGTLTIAPPGVLGNDTDSDGPAALTALLDVGPTHAAVSGFTLNADGSFTYTHDGGVDTSDTFTYHAFDGSDNSSIATVTITITPTAPANTAPTVTITAPADGATFTAGDSVTFTGTASDVPDGDLTSGLAWTSDLDGAIGTGGTFSTSALTVGTHVITAAATDSGALTGSATITITVNAAAPAFPATSVLDNFDRANGAVGANWAGQTGQFTVSGNALLPVAGGNLINWTTSFGANQEAFVTLATLGSGGSEIDLMLKLQANGNFTSGALEVLYNPTSHVVQVWAYDSTFATPDHWLQIGPNTPVTLAAGDVFGARATAAGQVEVYRNGSLLATYDVSVWPHNASGGYIGLWTQGVSGTFDNFGGGSLP